MYRGEESEARMEDAAVPVTETALAETPKRRRRLPTALTKTYAHTPAAQAITALEAAMGGREQLVTALLHVEPTGDAHTDAIGYVMGLIADPRHQSIALAELCRRGGISVGELLAAYKSGSHAKMQIALIAAAAANVPAIVADIYARAQPHWVTCTACKGTGTYAPKPTTKVPDPPPVPCDPCAGSGQQLVQPELARQELALDLAKLTPQKAPLLQQNTLNVGAGAGAQVDFTKLLAATDRVLHPRAPVPIDPAGPDVVDADVLDDAPVDDDTPPL